VQSILQLTNRILLRCRLTCDTVVRYSSNIPVTVVETFSAYRLARTASSDAALYEETPELGEYTVVINYVFENNDIVADPYTATLAAGSNFKANVPHPNIMGYLPYNGNDTVSSTQFTLDITNIQEDMTYTQSLDGTEMAAEGFETPIVTLNMPHMPEGFAADFFTLVLTDAEGQTMTRTLPAMTFLKGKRTVLNLVFVPDNGQGGNEGGEGGGNEGGEDPDQPDQPVTPEPEEPETITGTFTCATYNVDGLPAKVLGFISLNGDGPGSAGTTAISQKIATSGWDIVTFQENFTYNSELESAMSAYYTFGSHRKFSLLSALGTADTDGLGFATLNETCSFSGESWEAFTDAYGGLTDGANTSLKKGIRHYVVTMKDGVEIDLLVTHMNSGSDSGHISARASQLAQIAAYINKISANNRPIIFMGDTNCRYTRDDMFQYLFNNLDSNLTYADPWVEYSWDGVYPTLGSASLMVPSKDSSSTLTEQTGEVVDKIIYFNNPEADTQIVANYYLNDTSFAGMADHNPVVSEFTYVKTVK
ncbi:MAG: hypothetical protein II204_03005, partial [Alistipes sp.]|nr:hypothetical protein [Alistipes sp.]